MLSRRQGSAQLAFPQAAPRHGLGASTGQGPFPTDGLRGFPCLDGERTECYRCKKFLGATQQSWENFTCFYSNPEPRGTSVLWLQACKPGKQLICSSGLVQSKNMHDPARPGMPGCSGTRQSTSQEVARGSSARHYQPRPCPAPSRWDGHSQRRGTAKVCPQWHGQIHLLRNKPFYFLSVALSPDCLSTFLLSPNRPPCIMKNMWVGFIFEETCLHFLMGGFLSPPKDVAFPKF